MLCIKATPDTVKTHYLNTVFSKYSRNETQLELTVQWKNTWLLMSNSSINKQALPCLTFLWNHSAWNVMAQALVLRSESRKAEIVVRVSGCELHSHLGYFVLFRIGDFVNATCLKAPTCKLSTRYSTSHNLVLSLNLHKQATQFRNLKQRKWDTSIGLIFKPVQPAT